MFAVVDFHRLGIDAWFKRVGAIGKGGKFVGHGFGLSCSPNLDSSRSASSRIWQGRASRPMLEQNYLFEGV